MPDQPLLFPIDPIQPEPSSALLPELLSTVPPDQAARQAALDPSRSILVQAPAGAGKTSLLTQRYLALLAQVEEPEQILAITFTRAATAEMRHRILSALEKASEAEVEGAESTEQTLARAALLHAQRQGWLLLQQPHRLRIETIDSLCLRLAHSQPLLARLGGALSPTQSAEALYAEAARRTTALLAHSTDATLTRALETLLLRRDNNLAHLEQLLTGMLRRRDAWLGVLPLDPSAHVDWTEVRTRLEQPFKREHTRLLTSLDWTLQPHKSLTDELLRLARYAAGNRRHSSNAGLDLTLLETGPEAIPALPQGAPAWLALASLLLTQSGTWRARWIVSEGFPSDAKDKTQRKQQQSLKQRMKDCCQQLEAQAGSLLPLLHDLRTLPPLHYIDSQWHTLRAAFLVLRRATAELRLVFAQSDSVDFIELAQAAQQVLADEASTRGLLESEQTRHLLIDEFQDTSRSQYRLVAQLLREWSPGDGRTAFLVGDPLQSIYGFRQAEVALFHQTRAHGLPCGEPSSTPSDGAAQDQGVSRRHPCHPLQLTHNFRSHQALVHELNTRFDQVFPRAASSAQPETDTFVPATAWATFAEPNSFQLHGFFIQPEDQAPENEDEEHDEDQHEPPERGSRPELSLLSSFIPGQPSGGSRGESQSHSLPHSRAEARLREAARVVGILQSELPRIAAAQARGDSEYQVAVLVSARSHLAAILPALRAARIPYRAVDLEPLADRPEVHDLHMLLRALLHPADRLAWLTTLRAPWCGLRLSDLHILTGSDDPTLLQQPISALLSSRALLLSPDGQARLARTASVLRQAQRTRHHHLASLSQWLRHTWAALGGPACVGPTKRENTEAFFRLLDTLEPSGVELFRDDFAHRLAALCAAPDNSVSERYGIQLMTIHKAKGLGFQVVLLPGLERTTPEDSSELLAMLERTQPAASLESDRDQSYETELLLAPITSRDGDANQDDAQAEDSAYAWVNRQRKVRQADERKRVFYVACTRARARLHLFATLKLKRGELCAPAGNSLLAAAWPALQADLARQAQQALVFGGQSASQGMPRPEAAAGAAESRPQPAPVASMPGRAAAPLTGLTLAASAQSSAPAATLLRLPADWHAHSAAQLPQAAEEPPAAPLFVRAQGSLEARARGQAMHALLEQLAQPDQFSGQLDGEHNSQAVAQPGPEPTLPTLERFARRLLQQGAYPGEALPATAATLARAALRAAQHPHGQWLLAAHPEARSEAAWQSWEPGTRTLRTLRIDRSFVAGASPGTHDQTHLWIIDYKLGKPSADNNSDLDPDPAEDQTSRKTWLAEQQAFYSPQLEAYGRALTQAALEPRLLRYGLYFAELPHLLWWAPAP